MMTSKKLLSLFTLTTALMISGCSGGDTNISQNVTNVENNSSTSDTGNSESQSTKKRSTSTKAKDDQLAQSFVLEVGERELMAVMQGFYDIYQPSASCYDLWYQRREFLGSEQDKRNCKLWIRELSDLYASYGYITEPETFRSEVLWEALDTYGNEKYTPAFHDAIKNKTIPPNCAKAVQKNYRTPELIEPAAKRHKCKQFEGK